MLLQLKIWFDALTPKHYLMFASLERILGKSHELVLTTREYEELNRVRARVKIKTADNVIGRH
jgi:predicted glycosyltransferase